MQSLRPYLNIINRQESSVDLRCWLIIGLWRKVVDGRYTRGCSIMLSDMSKIIAIHAKVRTAASAARFNVRKLPACWHLDCNIKYRTERNFGIHSKLHFDARMQERGWDSRSKAIVFSLELLSGNNGHLVLKPIRMSHVTRSCGGRKKSIGSVVPQPTSRCCWWCCDRWTTCSSYPVSTKHDKQT